MNRKGIIIVVSGFSGAGKGTVMKALTAKYDQYALSVSATTRTPRTGEVNGREYFFVTTEEFEKRIKSYRHIFSGIVIIDRDLLGAGFCTVTIDCKELAVYSVLVLLVTVKHLLGLKVVFSYISLKSCLNDLSKIN